jgi:3-deoxy-D-manno-octulosonic acid (KDO) 8-phosphate synthase
VRSLRAFVVRNREEVESVRGKGFVRGLSSVSSVSRQSSSRVILDKV